MKFFINGSNIFNIKAELPLSHNYKTNYNLVTIGTSLDLSY